ncbi:hypothetical protein TRFO_13873 [Tritrichomonas foetus]|uniref:Uncharacterized protein n=1 Tax=Tritrichomonas foetus TaxID=1144522 RepID=A0A1J4L1E6_9EUKA|nr:hypothetical protein [Tritrichomonas foetus]OHT15709.1 hypothetical protein TRFO_13873 [Tritrichomonas foetus]|eukprot:OHT15709.1 hypothetical protein TRFO_13873 [Tritrichomonas foetus]
MSCPFCHNQASTLTASSLYSLPSANLKARGSTGVNFERPVVQPSTETILALRRQAGKSNSKCRCRTTNGQCSCRGAKFGSGKDVYPPKRPLGYPFLDAEIKPGQMSVYETICRSQSSSSGRYTGCPKSHGSGNVQSALGHLNQASRLLKY